MSEGQFRFRLPWLSVAAPALRPRPRPVAEPRPPPSITEIEAPPRPTTTIPILRPPFQSGEMAPAQPPPPPVQSSLPRTEAQPVLPPIVTTQRQSASPFRATTQRRAASVPPSPFRAAIEPQISQPASPSRRAPQSRATSVPSSPSRTSSEPETAVVQTPSQPKSPPRLASQHPGQASFQPSSAAKLDTEVPEPSQIEETKPKQEEITSQTVPKYQTEPLQASTNVTTATQALEKPVASQKSDSNILGAHHPAPMSEPRKPVEEKEGKRVIGEIKREGILSDDERKPQKEDISGNRKTIIGSNGEQMKTSRGRYAPSESHQKPAMPNGEKVPLHKEIREDISKFVSKLGTGLAKQAIGEKPVSLLTLAGENKGAFLHLGTESARKDGSGYIHREHKSTPDYITESTTDGEGSSKGRKPKDPAVAEDPEKRAYINSNTQGVNNSILFESSVTEGSPGVQQNLSYNLAEPAKQSAKPGPLEANKAEFNFTPAEKHTYEPTVERQCLRALVIEPSDSDPDNPGTRLRHGSRYPCGEMIEDRDVVIL